MQQVKLEIVTFKYEEVLIHNVILEAHYVN